MKENSTSSFASECIKGKQNNTCISFLLSSEVETELQALQNTVDLLASDLHVGSARQSDTLSVDLTAMLPCHNIT